MTDFALYIGRFQPFHDGHLDAINQMYEEGVRNLIIGIGSMQESKTSKNPFTVEERIEMIKRATCDGDISIVFFPIPDFNNPKLWAEYVCKMSPFPFTKVYSNNDYTIDSFKDIKIETIRLQNRLNICATQIRYEMSSQDNLWKEKIPKGTLEYLLQINGPERVRNILNADKKERLAADVIIEYENGVVLIERQFPPYGKALPGGLKDIGENIKQTAIREAYEETNLKVSDLHLLDVYSEPGRDPRGPVTSVVYYGKGKGELIAQDDAKSARVVPFSELQNQTLAFDHAKIISDWMKKRLEKEAKELELISLNS